MRRWAHATVQLQCSLAQASFLEQPSTHKRRVKSALLIAMPESVERCTVNTTLTLQRTYRMKELDNDYRRSKCTQGKLGVREVAGRGSAATEPCLLGLRVIYIEERQVPTCAVFFQLLSLLNERTFAFARRSRLSASNAFRRL